MRRVSGKTLLFGLIGHPVRHSLSPEMHNRLFESEGVDALYVAFDVPPKRANSVTEAIRTLDLRGCNLTAPFKGVVFEGLDRVTAAASEAMAANVVINHHGFLTGYNTDGEGFVRAFEGRFGATLEGSTAVVLGAGGAGQAIAGALAARGVGQLFVVNRTESVARQSVERLIQQRPELVAKALPFDPERLKGQIAQADLVVNCTSQEAELAVQAIDASVLRRDAVWCDINYWMKSPPHIDFLNERGVKTQRGLSMLAHQGALSFELFTGHPVDPQAIRRILG